MEMLLILQDTSLQSRFWRLGGLGDQLSPDYFRSIQSRRVICYELLRGWLLLSQPSRCLRSNTPPLTLSWCLGALTPVWVVSLSDAKLTPAPPLPRSTALENSEFDREVGGSPPVLLNQCSTSPATSREAELRFLSGGTRYHAVRLAFHP